MTVNKYVEKIILPNVMSHQNDILSDQKVKLDLDMNFKNAVPNKLAESNLFGSSDKTVSDNEKLWVSQEFQKFLD